MVSTWEPRLTARDDADPERVMEIVEALGQTRTTRAIDEEAWRVDMDLDPTDDPATARMALEQALDSIDENWRKLLHVEM